MKMISILHQFRAWKIPCDVLIVFIWNIFTFYVISNNRDAFFSFLMNNPLSPVFTNKIEDVRNSFVNNNLFMKEKRTKILDLKYCGKISLFHQSSDRLFLEDIDCCTIIFLIKSKWSGNHECKLKDLLKKIIRTSCSHISHSHKFLKSVEMENNGWFHIRFHRVGIKYEIKVR